MHTALNDVLGEFTPSIQTVYKWAASILDGKNEMKDDAFSRASELKKNVHLVKIIVEENKRRTCENLTAASALRSTVEVNPSFITAHDAINEVFSLLETTTKICTSSANSLHPLLIGEHTWNPFLKDLFSCQVLHRESVVQSCGAFQ